MASGSLMEMRVPSTAGVMHAIAILPCVSDSSLKTFTAH